MAVSLGEKVGENQNGRGQWGPIVSISMSENGDHHRRRRKMLFLSQRIYISFRKVTSFAVFEWTIGQAAANACPIVRLVSYDSYAFRHRFLRTLFQRNGRQEETLCTDCHFWSLKGSTCGALAIPTSYTFKKWPNRTFSDYIPKFKFGHSFSVCKLQIVHLPGLQLMFQSCVSVLCSSLCDKLKI